jgi:hypothetical protein
MELVSKNKMESFYVAEYWKPTLYTIIGKKLFHIMWKFAVTFF